jgi:hypothetical protein
MTSAPETGGRLVPAADPAREEAAGDAAMRAWRLAEVRRTALFAWLPLAVILLIALVFSLATDVNVRQLTQDPSTVLEAPFYTGALSNLGNTLWAAAVCVCLLTALGLGDRITPAARRFLAVSGAYTAVLLFDDQLLLHDEILPRYAGISGEVYGLLYVLATIAYVYVFRLFIAGTNYLLIGASLALFGISIAFDLGSSTLSEILPAALVILIEDGAKFLAIATWLAYFISTAVSAVRAGSPALAVDGIDRDTA